MSLFATSQVSSDTTSGLDSTVSDSSTSDSSVSDSTASDSSSSDSALEDNAANDSVQAGDETGTDNQTTVLVKKITLNKKTAKLRYGKKLKLKATVTPSSASNKKVKWSVSKSKYASVTEKGVVKAKKKGIGHTVKVYAAAKDGSGKRAVCTVKIRR
jgi:uncharacterized protein YjdB